MCVRVCAGTYIEDIIRLDVCVCMYVYIQKHARIHTCMRKYMLNTHTHTHTHTRMCDVSRNISERQRKQIENCANKS